MSSYQEFLIHLVTLSVVGYFYNICTTIALLGTSCMERFFFFFIVYGSEGSQWYKTDFYFLPLEAYVAPSSTTKAI